MVVRVTGKGDGGKTTNVTQKYTSATKLLLSELFNEVLRLGKLKLER